MTKQPKYRKIVAYLKKGIQVGEYPVNSYIPSEHEICHQFKSTRTTVRRALDELIQEGFILKEHGRGSRVVERNNALGLLTVKGFSGSTDFEVRTVISVRPTLTVWAPLKSFELTEEEKSAACVYFQRIRHINDIPVVVENNWYSSKSLGPIQVDDFVEGSFFKTLRQKYLIEIMGVEQEIRSIAATTELAEQLRILKGTPILHITVRFRTSKLGLNLYGELYCNTTEYPIHNSYFI